jgi:hypothetical protein
MHKDGRHHRQPDTSYTINSAYAGTIKTNPEAKLVDELHFSNLVEEKNITYCKSAIANF